MDGKDQFWTLNKMWTLIHSLKLVFNKLCFVKITLRAEMRGLLFYTKRAIIGLLICDFRSHILFYIVGVFVLLFVYLLVNLEIDPGFEVVGMDPLCIIIVLLI